MAAAQAECSADVEDGMPAARVGMERAGADTADVGGGGNDRPVMVAYLMLVAGLFVAINLAVDLAYVGLDPRIGGSRG